MAISERLSALQRDHDRDPEAAAHELRGIAMDAVPDDELARFTTLLNHVLGQKLGAWTEVQARYAEGLHGRTGLPLAVLRNVAAAARLAGDEAAALAAQRAVRDAARLSDAQAALVADLGALMYGMPEPPDGASAARLTALCEGLDGWDHPTAADALVAAMTNNITSAFLELPAARFTDPIVAAALERGARASRRFWSRGGTWLNAMRADYLVAMALNRIGQAEEAARHALAAIEAIRRHGPHDVDEAFVQLELAHAQRALGRGEASDAARRRADALAAAFGDDGLSAWYAGVAGQLDRLPR